MHKDNLHKNGYSFPKLITAYPPLSNFIIKNKVGEDTINFADAAAVIALNKALLKAYYNVNYWDIPKGYLCPPVPGRADYILGVKDLLLENTNLKDQQIKGLDIGTGANIIYPLLGKSLFGWDFVGSDIEELSIDNAVNILKKNKISPKKIAIRRQKSSTAIFRGIIRENERFAFSMCNPPFHKSFEDAQKGSRRKAKNLTGKSEVKLNFGGKSNELWCDGGEYQFIKSMISESVNYQQNVVWFTTLVSKQENVVPLLKQLKKIKPHAYKVIDMGQGQKKSRFIAWTFMK
ncbi:23S rRNA (adenine(1618)-N(6))-methyltransferase RlmF [Flammeovirga sp. EKP202]|uniref:23S rRNA (adenine(1618)-N(6))-methyltransferase RlmF n=1 Tax=Flammeovirga sp. EKP202 TaxID=2770592 RepID=UPI00165ED270|nr:23S rRNA (adenine(1618)-N(6))-methyltransferase RlmF [Flammeovirga sp. EKP202]MBD0402342.1 23S rRNA (adenine(1618)-N(6))-methyltransferase RlmF [Flammeovirga sp. EKP202]